MKHYSLNEISGMKSQIKDQKLSQSQKQSKNIFCLGQDRVANYSLEVRFHSFGVRFYSFEMKVTPKSEVSFEKKKNDISFLTPKE